MKTAYKYAVNVRNFEGFEEVAICFARKTATKHTVTSQFSFI